MKIDYKELDNQILTVIKTLEENHVYVNFSSIEFMCRERFTIKTKLHKRLSARCNGGLYLAIGRRLQNLRKNGMIGFSKKLGWHTTNGE